MKQIRDWILIKPEAILVEEALEYGLDVTLNKYVEENPKKALGGNPVKEGFEYYRRVTREPPRESGGEVASSLSPCQF